MEIFLGVLGMIGLIVPLVLWCWLNKQFYDSARDKGYEEKRYFWISFLGGIIGWLLIISLPDRGNDVATTSDIVKVINQTNLDKNYDRDENDNFIPEERPLASNEWRCSVCGRINQTYVGTCACGQIKPSK